jgi:hypothetical protein
MAFQKGESGNPYGRKKGSLNRTTKELREMIQEVIHSNFSKTKISKDLKQLTPKFRLEFDFKLLEFILPKPISTVIEDEKTSHSDFVANIMQQMSINKLKALQDAEKQNQAY